MALIKNILRALTSLEKLYGNNILKLYHTLINIPDKNKLIKNKIDELKKTDDIFCYENSKNILSKVDLCPICLETTNVIPKKCAHFYCYDCFLNVTKCVICRINL